MRDKWVCIDDEIASTLGPYLAALEEASDKITLSRVPLGEIGSVVADLKAASASGFLVDLRLDETADDNGNKVSYRGLTLAQELRTRMTEGELRQAPMVLWSVDRKLRSSWEGDDTGHDLFDRVYVKDRDVAMHPERTARELASLSKGYQLLEPLVPEGINGFWLALGLQGDESNILDVRITEGLVLRERHFAHEWSRFILGQLIDRSGPLMSEDLLLARLGIDRAKSPGWSQLRQVELDRVCSYDGIFAEGWQRWWTHRLEDWWRTLPNKPGELRTLRAGERVEYLRKTFGQKGLVAAEPIEEGYGDRFWTLCMGLLRPLEMTDGVVAMASDLRAWQDRPYLSMRAALDRKGRPKWRPHPFEEARIRVVASIVENEA